MQLVKYPKTMHLPWSPNLQNDDRLIENLKGFKNREVVITEKMDGESTSIYRNHIHARSLDSTVHESRHWLIARAATFQYRIPVGWRICGENCYAKHSIHYKNLTSYFYGFSIWNDKNECLSWDETLRWFDELGITPVQQLYRVSFDKVEWSLYENIKEDYEGYVVRITDSFHYDDFQKYVAKYVRKNHVQTDEHWMNSEIVRNICIS